jgi:hypothetical protein
MHIIPFFHHVKGHQDNKQEYTNKLPLEAQLNVEADHQVGSYYHMNLVDNASVHMIPGNNAKMTINGYTIPSGYKHAI